MKKIALFFFFIFCFICCSTSEKNEILIAKKEKIPAIWIQENNPKISIENGTIFHDKKPFSGHLFQLYPNTKDSLVSQEYFNGLLSGISTKWFPNKQVAEKRFYYKGEKHGKQLSYWENGTKKFDFTALKDTYEGVLKEWDEKGNLYHLANFKNGQEEGVQKLWYENGKIRANYVIINGKRYGLLGTKNCKNVSDSIFNLQ